MSELKNCLFDFDMTLVDSIKPLVISANLIANEFGLPEVDYDKVYRAEVSVPNCTFEALWQNLWGFYDPAWFKAYVDRFTDAEYRAMDLFEGGRETIETLFLKGVTLGLASNRDYPAKILKVLGIDNFFRAAVGQFDVKRVKPYPDMLLKAMELLGAEAQNTLYVCDSKGDLLAAAAAGVRAFAMSTGGHSKEEMSSLGAWRVGDRLAEVIDCF
ncbi:MAG: HAD family hydrolase [Deltaproteobacteria bacterium]|jgi:phosphoglycolate phosphatase|nr:HAD family hydrolase [Deltaproteobacteria bacterium]